jgi:glucose-6-phosphate 1-dehydrogenase
VTVTEVVARFRKPPLLVNRLDVPANYLRFRLTPDFVIALGVVVRAPGETIGSEAVELDVARREEREMGAYDMLLGDALAGDSFRFARQDYVEEAWRIFDPAIKSPPAIHVYAPGTWGPKAADDLVPGGWLPVK